MNRSRRPRRHVPAHALVVALVVIVGPLLSAGPAAAEVFSDISDADWQAGYHVAVGDVCQLARGYPDGSFRPELPVARWHFAKMAINAFGLLLWNYPEPLYSDVPPGSYYYPWVMGASFSAGFLDGYPDGTFRPVQPVTREEAYRALGPWVLSPEDVAVGGIQGADAIYASIPSWYRQEGHTLLESFADMASMPLDQRPSIAFLVMRGVIRGVPSGGSSYLMPKAELNRAQAVTLLLRARAATFGVVPTVTHIEPVEGPAEGGTMVVITGTGFTDMDATSPNRSPGVRFGDTMAASFAVDSPTQVRAVAPPHEAGVVDVQVTNGGGGTSAMVAADRFTYRARP